MAKVRWKVTCDAGRLFNTLVTAADRSLIPAPAGATTSNCRPSVSGEDIRLTTQNLLLLPSRRDGLALALRQAILTGCIG